ncbi:MAG: Flp pilus assembly complex ATPase component TadA, partial [Anaerolineae bacterium]|nr:Flp pilus assembly complex ATPase component TadA [Anaerolineae bacterium]
MGSLLKKLGNTNSGTPNQGGGTSGGGEQPPPQPRPNPATANRPQNPNTTNKGNSNYMDLKSRVQQKLLMEFDQKMDTSKKDEIRRHIEELFNSILAEESMVLSRNERQRLFEAIVDDILGFGPIEPLLDDDSVSEIMVNGPRMVFAERKGQLSRTNITFDSDEHVMRIIDRIVSPLGRRVDESSPLVDARLPDGSRVNVVIRPIALCGPTIT